MTRINSTTFTGAGARRQRMENSFYHNGGLLEEKVAQGNRYLVRTV